MTRSSSPSGLRGRHRRSPGPGRWALPWLLLLALTWQSFVTQTHRHWDALGTAATAGQVASADTGADRQSPLDSPVNCPLCREIASAGPVLLPAPVTLALPAPIAFFVTSVRPLGLSLSQRSHVWRSRAPPQQLQA